MKKENVAISTLHQTESERREGASATNSARGEEKNEFQRHQLTTSPGNITLPDELVVNILSLLSPKPFFRLKSVSKRWLALSSDAFPLNKHLQPTLRGFFYNKSSFGANFANLSSGTDKVEIDETISALSSLSWNNHLTILDCCNGLLLVKVPKKLPIFGYDFHVYNPATWTPVAVLPVQTNEQYDYQRFSLAFDPRAYPEFHIISFSSVFKDGETFNFIDICSFEKGECRLRKRLVSNVTIHTFSKGAFVDGRVHRLTDRDKILTVDPKVCSYQVMEPPNLESPDLIRIGESQGLLHCMSVCNDKRLFIWVLENFTNQKWTLNHQLNLSQIYSVWEPQFEIPDIYGRMGVLGHFVFHPEKDTVFMPLGREAFLSFNLSTRKRIDAFGDLSDRVSVNCWAYIPCYFA